MKEKCCIVIMKEKCEDDNYILYRVSSLIPYRS